MNMANEYDAIVIGTGAGGGTLALHLAQAGKNILILERGPFMPQEKLNWDTSAVFLDNRYHTKETWQDKDGKPLHPQQAYFVGGQTKVYGAAMFRMRAEDFGVIQHKGGISPAWPITYADMEPFYCRAEELFHVHGDLGSAPSVPGGYGSSFDPTEPFHSIKYPYPGVQQRASHADHRGRRAQARHPYLPHSSWAQAQRRPTRWPRSASAATPATATPAWCTPSPMRTSTASGRSCTCPTSP